MKSLAGDQGECLAVGLEHLHACRVRLREHHGGVEQALIKSLRRLLRYQLGTDDLKGSDTFDLFGQMSFALTQRFRRLVPYSCKCQMRRNARDELTRRE